MRMATPLEQALATVVSTFRKYAELSGGKHGLCQAGLKELLQKELPTWTPVSPLGAQAAGQHCLDSAEAEPGTSPRQVGYRRGRGPLSSHPCLGKTVTAPAALQGCWED